MNKWKKAQKIIMIILLGAILFSVFVFIGVNNAYVKVFSRADYDEYNTAYYYTYDEIDTD